jgi:hypothetical protein
MSISTFFSRSWSLSHWQGVVSMWSLDRPEEPLRMVDYRSQNYLRVVRPLTDGRTIITAGESNAITVLTVNPVRALSVCVFISLSHAQPGRCHSRSRPYLRALPRVLQRHPRPRPELVHHLRLQRIGAAVGPA